jgi:hypothetical protein
MVVSGREAGRTPLPQKYLARDNNDMAEKSVPWHGQRFNMTLNP